jgi:O-succinylbenzoate synthase
LGETFTPIGSIELREVAIPLLELFETRYGVEHSKHALLVLLRKSDTIAFSECVAGTGQSYNEETVVSAKQIIKNQLAPILLKERLKSPTDFLEAAKRVRGSNMAVAAIEMALWDLQGKIEGVSMSRLFAGVREKVDACATVGLHPTPRQLVQRVNEFVTQGYHAIKLKIKPGFDVEYVQAVQAKFPDINLRADANGAYRFEHPSLNRLDKLGLSSIEQPLAQDDLTGHSKLQKELSTPICLDESIQSPHDAKGAIEMEACRVINIKPGRVRGMSPSREIHDICIDHKIPVLCGGMLETGIGRAFNVALATLPGFTLPSDLSASNRYFKKDLIKNEFELSPDGKLTVPTGTGCGVMVDESYLASITISREVLTRT